MHETRNEFTRRTPPGPPAIDDEDESLLYALATAGLVVGIILLFVAVAVSFA